MNDIPSERHLTIVALGDSITEALEVDCDKRWPSILQEQLGALSILVEFGGNDALYDGDRFVDVTEFVANLNSVATRSIQACNAAVILLTFPPTIDDWMVQASWPSVRERGGPDRVIENYRQAMRDFAEEHNFQLIDIDCALREVCGRDGPGGYFQSDGVHLTEQGHRVVADCVYAGIHLINPA